MASVLFHIKCVGLDYLREKFKTIRCEHFNSMLAAAAACQGTGGVGVAAKALPLSPLAQATIEKHLPGLPSRRLLQQAKVQKRDAACITDICGSEHLPEVEIFSLLEEQIPKYKIRADTLTQFGGYENQDWFIPSPALPIPVDGLGLTKDQIREALNYFLLCGNRVSQMTRAYDDIEAVTRLLEEKEKDLELTVQIGKELLTQNNRLENRVAELEAELKSANENLAQLSHDLHQKNDLVAILTNDCDTDSGSENVTPCGFKSINLDLLQKKISNLEVENKSLRVEAMQLSKDTDECEEQERRLMADITQQLNSANYQYDGINLELERHKEENRLQHEQIVNLTSRLTETEIRLHQITVENEEHTSLLGITKENQNLLAGELVEFKARYQEVLSLLHETQEQLRRQKKRQPAMRSFIPGLSVPQADSLHSELMETSLFSENSLDSGIHSERGGHGGVHGMGGSVMSGMGVSGISGISGLSGAGSTVPPYKKVFETVRCVSRTNNFSDGMSQLGAMSMSSASQPRMSSSCALSASLTSGKGVSSGYGSAVNMRSAYPSFDGSMGARTQSRESLLSADADEGYPAHASSGMPGVPGAKDLEAALRRLTPAEVLARRAMLAHAPAGTYTYDEAPAGIPLGCRTPDSIMSTGSSGLSTFSSNAHQPWRLPEKLQIVKPLEGSQTLHHWTRLATPTLGGLLDERPGVTIRGGRGLEALGMQTYCLSDVEEDAADDHPGKQFQFSGCVYTYTNSTVMHPDDGTSVTFSAAHSQMSSHVTSACSSRQSTAPPTPRAGLSRRNSCSTFSVNLGLASMLNERGIKAVTASTLNTPCGPNFSPTSTPCNSPEGSPPRADSPEPPFFAGFIASGADMLRRRIGTVPEERPSRGTARNKITLTHLERRALRSLKILEKVEHSGIGGAATGSSSSSTAAAAAAIANVSPLALHSTSALYGGVGGARSRTASPMAQLTSFKSLAGGTGLHAALAKGGSSGGGYSSCDSLSGISDTGSSDLSSSAATSISGQVQRLQSAAAATQRTASPSGARVKQMQRQRSRRSMVSGGGAQRPDLGTVRSGAPMRSDLGTVAADSAEKPVAASAAPLGFVGTISTLLFGRKGGLL